jgi:uncharacterized protein
MDQSFVGIGTSFKDRVRLLVERLREGDKELLEGGFRDILEDTDPFQLERAEEELIEEGLSRDDILLLCDARIGLFGEISEDEETYLERPGHPIHVLMEEHRHILKFMKDVRDMASMLRLGGPPDLGDRMTLSEVGPFLKEAQKHFQREENVLFPYMEKHGIEGPPAAMWSEHEVLRANEKELLSLIGRRRYMDPGEFAASLECQAATLLSLLNAHFYKENHELFPMSIRTLDVHEWNDARKQLDEIGCCNFVQHQAALDFAPLTLAEPPPSGGQEIVLPTGRFTLDELEMVLNKLPVDFTFVDDQDRVRYYSGSPERIFVRTPAVIGRAVQNCHPQGSVHIVQRIIDEFKAGTREKAEFWIEVQGRFVHIRYFPLRDKQGKYQGVLEMAQDITGIRKLEGQKRLLDEK